MHVGADNNKVLIPAAVSRSAATRLKWQWPQLSFSTACMPDQIRNRINHHQERPQHHQLTIWWQLQRWTAAACNSRGERTHDNTNNTLTRSGLCRTIAVCDTLQQSWRRQRTRTARPDRPKIIRIQSEPQPICRLFVWVCVCALPLLDDQLPSSQSHAASTTKSHTHTHTQQEPSKATITTQNISRWQAIGETKQSFNSGNQQTGHSIAEPSDNVQSVCGDRRVWMRNIYEKHYKFINKIQKSWIIPLVLPAMPSAHETIVLLWRTRTIFLFLL